MADPMNINMFSLFIRLTVISAMLRNIVNGAPPFDIINTVHLSTIEKVPSLVSIHMNNKFLCTGNIVSPDIVITTLNCIIDQPRPERYTIRAGTLYANFGGAIKHLKGIFWPPMPTDMKVYLRDICLLQVAIPFTNTPILIHSKYDWHGGEVAYFYKFIPYNLYAFSTDTVEPVVELTVKMNSRILCNKLYAAENTAVAEDIVSSEHLRNVTINANDSGSPLIIHNQLIGILSWYMNNTMPVCYTDVPLYKTWIQMIIQKAAAERMALK